MNRVQHQDKLPSSSNWVGAITGNGCMLSWAMIGTGRTGYSTEDYAQTLPDDISSGTTGRVCIDSFSRDLRSTGYLHNHGRMWSSLHGSLAANPLAGRNKLVS